MGLISSQQQERLCAQHCRARPKLGRGARATQSRTRACPTNPSSGCTYILLPHFVIPRPTTVPSASSPGVFVPAGSFSGLEEISPRAPGHYFRISSPMGANTRARWAWGPEDPTEWPLGFFAGWLSVSPPTWGYFLRTPTCWESYCSGWHNGPCYDTKRKR